MDFLEDKSTVERMLLSQAFERRLPMNGSLELLPLCNLNCRMCYVRLDRQEMERQGRLRRVEEWLALAREMKESGVLFLLLTGGEPLLYPGFRELFVELKHMGMILTVNTNGTLLDEDWAAFFGTYKPRRINLTLYGAGEETYGRLCQYPQGFEKAVRGVELLRQHQVDVKLSCSMTRENATDAAALQEIADRLGVPVNMDVYMMPAERERGKPFHQQSRLGPEAAATLDLETTRRRVGEEVYGLYARSVVSQVESFVPPDNPATGMACMAGKCSFTVNWQGKMRPCVMLPAPEANVFELGFAKAWEQVWQGCERIQTSAGCASCRLRLLCRTCGASELLEEGSFGKEPRYLCAYAKERFRLLQEAAEASEEGQGSKQPLSE